MNNTTILIVEDEEDGSGPIKDIISGMSRDPVSSCKTEEEVLLSEEIHDMSG